MKQPFSIATHIERFSSKGWGVGSFQKTPSSPVSKVVVPSAVPGDHLLVEVYSKKKGGYQGKCLEILHPSLDRQEPRCKHVGVCGGCVWQAMHYEKQLFYKEEVIRSSFQGLFEGNIEPIVLAEDPWRYRNKMEYTFSQNKEGHRFLGLMQGGSKGRVEDLTECHLSPKWFLSVLEVVKSWWEESGLAAFHPLKNTGTLRTLTVREGRQTGHKMIVLTVSGSPAFAIAKTEINRFVSSIKEAFPQEEISLFLRVQQAVCGSPTQFYEMHLSGADHILEELKISLDGYVKNYTLKISPTAFFQPNTLQAQRLYSKALAMTTRKSNKLVLDLYAGTATLGMIFAPFAEKVISIEINPYAVFDARSNQERNLVSNLEIMQGDVAEVLSSLQIFKADLVIVDPPRTGLSEEALSLLVQTEPGEILYISCAPATQARDCLWLKQRGYEIVAICPVDQFPHTIHIENIVLLRRSFSS